MLRDWIIRWVFNRNRRIYRYWDGRRRRAADPMVVYQRLLSCDDFDIETTPQLAEAGDLEAAETTADAVRHAFDLPAFNGWEGLTILECMDLLGVYLGYLLALKKNIRHSPTTLSSTGSPADSASSNSSDSGSTSTENESGTPSVSAAE